jgi:DNA-directed RNA polymerase I, II, and III subunit RPABC2
MDEKDEYPSDIESETESEPENVLALPKKTNFNTINKNDDEDYEYDETEESVESEIEEEDDDADEYFDDNVDEVEKIFKSDENTTKTSFNMIDDDDDADSDDDDNDDDENYLQKFNENIKRNVITDYHPELQFHNYEEIENLTTIIRNENGTIVDPLHQTLPFLTKYEKTRILGQRSKQIECGAKPLVKVPENVIDSYLIAELELEQKAIPFIIRRPIPSGGSEYWNLKDLEMISF